MNSDHECFQPYCTTQVHNNVQLNSTPISIQLKYFQCSNSFLLLITPTGPHIHVYMHPPHKQTPHKQTPHKQTPHKQFHYKQSLQYIECLCIRFHEHIIPATLYYIQFNPNLKLELIEIPAFNSMIDFNSVNRCL